ncbi:hypothetical protein VTI74DRAFT_3886 [Chaetomium olivicolor]
MEGRRGEEHPGRAKGKPGRKPARPDEQKEAEDQTPENTSVRRSGRERRSADDKPWWAANEASPEAARPEKGRRNPAQKPKHVRPSLAEVSVSRAQNQAGSSQADGQAKKSGRPSRPSNEGVTSKRSTQPQNQVTRKQPPQPHPSGTEQAEPPAAFNSQYSHLTTLTRQIPRSTISAKWTPLDTPSITAIDSIIADSTRPVLHRLRDRDARHAQAQTILRTFAARLHSKLVKGMPFPPPSIPSSTKSKTKGRGKTGSAGGREAELDFEQTVDAIAALERALDPLLHSVELLKKEKEREEGLLRREYESLRKLEMNARAQARGWKEQRGRGRGHVLLPHLQGGGRSGNGEWDGERRLEVAKMGERACGIFTDVQDEELLALSQQIGNHMESMKSNLGQIEGVLPAIEKAKAALQGTLCEYLDQEQYDQVVLG